MFHAFINPGVFDLSSLLFGEGIAFCLFNSLDSVTFRNIFDILLNFMFFLIYVLNPWRYSESHWHSVHQRVMMLCYQSRIKQPYSDVDVYWCNRLMFTGVTVFPLARLARRRPL